MGLRGEDSIAELCRRKGISQAIKNIRAIRNLELDFGSQSHGPSPWMMLLGENGTGKSTVLQSVALVLSGHDQVKNLLSSGRLDPTTMVR